jgi:two-component system, response regulator
MVCLPISPLPQIDIRIDVTVPARVLQCSPRIMNSPVWPIWGLGEAMIYEGQKILLVEDNNDDAELTMRAFRLAKIKNPLVRATDGEEALNYLFGRGEHEGRDVSDLPAVALLDINMPKINGPEVLAAIRADHRTTHLPVVMLTSSNEDKDRLRAYSHHANSYVVKPVDYDQFVAAATQLGLYWMVLNEPAPRTKA